MKEPRRVGPNTVSGRDAEVDEAWICRMLREITHDPALQWLRRQMRRSEAA